MFKPLLFMLIPAQVLGLAPPPINFQHERVKVDDKIYDLDFDGQKLTMNEEPSSPPWIGLLIVATLLFWPSFFALVFQNRNILIDTLIVYLMVILMTTWRGK